jgi:hypothetical protein
MSAAAAFAESGHILSGMSTRPRSEAGPPMTLGNMRANGVRSLDVSCWQCHHRTILSADPWPDHLPVPTFGHRLARQEWRGGSNLTSRAVRVASE